MQPGIKKLRNKCMNTKKISKKDIIALAQQTKHHCNLLITQCDNWLPEEEGMKNLREKFKSNKKFSLK